jgi:hypothetical protein
MNKLLEQYVVDVDFPNVSGIEHLNMLEIRTQLTALESTLSSEEREALAMADHKLAGRADQFFAELSRFINLADERRTRGVHSDWWWWYLDVLAKAPVTSRAPQTYAPVPV